MATQVTQNNSPSRNWKKYWRYASSPRNHCPSTSIKVTGIPIHNLRPYENPDFKRIDTDYQGTYSVCGKSPTFPEWSILGPRLKIYRFYPDLYARTEKHGSADREGRQATISKEPRIKSLKRPAEESYQILIYSNQQSPTEPKPKCTKLQSKVKWQDTESRKRHQHSSTFSTRHANSPTHFKPKILKLEENYCHEKRHNQQSGSNKLGKRIVEKAEHKDTVDCVISLNERDCFQPLELFEARNYPEESIYEDDWKKSLRPSLSDVTLPATLRDSNVTIDYDDEGNANLLGEGVYGFVTCAYLKTGEHEHNCAVKFFRQSRSSRKMIFNEARMLHYLANTGAVPKLFGVLEVTNNKPAIVQECCADGQDLYNLLDQRSTSKKDWVTICLNAAKGLSQIHSKLVIINDIKPDNILVDNNNNIRFIDMGMATLGRGMTYPSGPELDGCEQTAPECWRDGEETNIRSDIFSFGFVMKSVGDSANVPELTDLSKLLQCAQPLQRIDIVDTIRRLEELEAAIEDC